eukprot:363940-Chlamydomonas_euryale.AAC.5
MVSQRNRTCKRRVNARRAALECMSLRHLRLGAKLPPLWKQLTSCARFPHPIAIFDLLCMRHWSEDAHRHSLSSPVPVSV